MNKYCYMDIETTGLHRKKDKITFVGAFLPDKDKCIILKEPPKAKLKKLLRKIKNSNRKVVWHNGVFDTSFIQAQHGIIFPIDEDSILLAHAYDVNQSKSLKKLATEKLGLPDWDIDLDTKKGKGSIKDLRNYLEKDLRNGWEVFLYTKEKFEKLPQKTQKVYYEIMLPATSAIRQMQANGIYFDKARAKKEVELFNAELDEVISEIYDCVPKEFHGINLNSPKQLSSLFEALDFPVVLRSASGARSTSSEAIKLLSKEVTHDFLDLLIKYRKVSKCITFLKDWLEREYESRLYPSFNLTGTKTGRLSSSEPNLQQVPREPRLRTLFTAPVGRFVEADFSQLELRIASHVANDKAMQKAYLDGEDLHTKTARLFNAEPSKEDRTKAKSMNFGLLYGMQATTYRDYAFMNYDLEFTKKEATKIRSDFFKVYKQLIPYHKDISARVQDKGRLFTIFGRLRRFPDARTKHYTKKKGAAIRAAINFPVQSVGSDILVGCIIEIHKRYPEIKLVGTVHDSILLEVTKKSQLKQIEDLMNDPQILKTFGIKLKVPLESDVAAGPWGTH